MNSYSFKIVILILFMCHICLASNRWVTGDIISSTKWTDDTVIVIGNITVLPEIVLTLKPGTSVLFMGNYMLTVKGTLIAQGTERDTILFTRILDSNLNHSSYWGGIVFDSISSNADSSIISFCMIEYALGFRKRSNSFSIGINNFSKIRISNSVVTSGGHIYCNNASILITDNTIIENSNIHGAGIYCDNDSKAIITRNLISRNRAEAGAGVGFGGGISCSNSSPYIANNVITNNKASGRDSHGGGICCWYSSKPDIVNNIIAGNSAKYGGAIYSYVPQQKLINNVIYGNSALRGGGLYLRGVNDTLTMLVVNNTIFSNSANQGGGIYVHRKTACPIVINSVIWRNSPDQIYDTATVSYSAIEGGYEGVGNSDTYPIFKDTLQYNLSLSTNSPCINTGNPDTNGLHLPEYDIYGNPRILGARIDMGAYEFDPTTAISCNYFHVDKQNEILTTFNFNEQASNNKFKLLLSEQSPYQVHIYNVLGRKVFGDLKRRSIASGKYVVLIKSKDDMQKMDLDEFLTLMKY